MNYLHLSAPIAEASDNSRLNSAAKIVENFENPSIDRQEFNRLNESYGLNGQNGVSVLPDTDRDAARGRALALGERLHTPINIIEDVSEISHRDKSVQERRRNSKGWYDAVTGEVYVVLPNNRDVEDVAATMLHETVGHKGLREIIGDDNYNDFLREVYHHVKADVRRRIAKLAAKYNWDFEKATDEYLAGLAEKGFEDFDSEERSVWQWLKDKVLKAIDKFLKSLRLPGWVRLGDNELRYMLWRSKERLERGKEHPFDVARDVVKREELGLTDEARYSMGDAPETFEARQRRAVENKGTVMPGLNEAEVKVVDIPKHTYTGGIAEATQQAIDAAKAKYAPDGKPKTLHYDNFGASFDYAISGNAVKECLNPKQQAKSTNKGVHLALAEHLDRVIGESIEVEEHPDRFKKDGERDNNNINPDALMHRFYGVARIDGKDYRVMTLMKEENRTNRGNGVHSCEVQKIEVLDENTPNTSNGVGTLNSELEGYPLAKVIEEVGKTMEKGKNLLAESKKADEDTAFYRDGDNGRDEKNGQDDVQGVQGNGRNASDVANVWKDKSMGLLERMTASAALLSGKHTEDRALRNNAMRAISSNLSDLRKAMSLQKRFDVSTVKRVYDLARVLMAGGYLSDLSQQEVKRLLAAVKNSVGREDIEGSVQKIMDIMVDNQLKRAEAALASLDRIRGSKVDARGVEVFSDYYTNRKASSAARKTRSVEAQADTDNAFSDAKLHKVIEDINISQEIFVSNAARAVEGIKQEKATPIKRKRSPRPNLSNRTMPFQMALRFLRMRRAALHQQNPTVSQPFLQAKVVRFLEMSKGMARKMWKMGLMSQVL